MVKLNYTNRRNEGLKMGQIVAKDLKKRLPEGSSFKAAQRDPVVELDVTGRALTDEGFTEIVTTLLECLQKTPKTFKIEELMFRECLLTAASLMALSRLISLIGGDIRDLDLSFNRIRIEDSQEVIAWEQFLKTFRHCYVLSRLDLSYNPLGQKGFEVFSKIYLQSEMLDFLDPSKDDEDNNELSRPALSSIGENDATPTLGSQETSNRLGRINIRGTGKGKAGALRKSIFSKFTSSKLKRASAARMAEGEETRAMMERSHYLGTRGLRSISYIVLQNTIMSDTCALHLSGVIKEHLTPGNLLPRVPYAAGSAAEQRFERYDRNLGGCKGLIYLPNGALTPAGHKMLYLAEALRNTEFIDDDAELIPGSRSHRLHQGKESNEEADMLETAPSDGEEDRRRREYFASLKAQFSRAKSRLEGEALKMEGPHSVELWGVAIRMLAVARVLLLDGKEKKPQEALEGQELAHSSSSPEHPTSGQPSLPGPSNGRETSLAHPEPPHVTAAGLRMTNPMSNNIPEAVTTKILAYAVGAHGVLSSRQQLSVVKWARSYQSLWWDRELRGKPRYAQWWHILNQMNCLTYERSNDVVRI